MNKITQFKSYFKVKFSIKIKIKNQYTYLLKQNKKKTLYSFEC